MNPCENLPILEFFEGDLGKPEVEKLLKHLEVCTDCRERLQVTAALAALKDTPREKRALSTATARYLLAAAACLLIGVALFLLFHLGLLTTSVPPEDLTTGEAHPYFPLETRGRLTESPDEAREEAFRHYSAGRYEEADRAFSRLEPEADVLFFRGVARFLLRRDREALEDLERATDLDPRWRRPSLWYGSNIHLRLGERNRAVAKLQELARAEGEYQRNAVSLLERLETGGRKGGHTP